MTKEKYYIVNDRSLPDVFKKVVEVKELLRLEKCKDITEAIKRVGISRSTYYKYKDDISFMDSGLKTKKVTLLISISHKTGTLSKVLDCIAFYKGNILTINQDIPINSAANVNVTIDISNMEKTITHLATRLNTLSNVISVRLLASE